MLNAAVTLASVILFMQPGPAAPPEFSAKLLASHESIAPGATTELMVKISVGKSWHIYHPIILDTGLATDVQFTTPPGFEIGDLRFPVPELGESSPPRMFSSVLLPLPEGPSKTTNSPRNKSRSTPRNACTSTSPMW